MCKYFAKNNSLWQGIIITAVAAASMELLLAMIILAAIVMMTITRVVIALRIIVTRVRPAIAHRAGIFYMQTIHHWMMTETLSRC
jgi:hypothetical protein